MIRSSKLAKRSGKRRSPRSNSSRDCWSGEEERLLFVGLRAHGRGEWQTIASTIPTRSLQQVKTQGVKVIRSMARRTAKGVDVFASYHDEENQPVVGEGSWTDEERRLFLIGLKKYGPGKWAKIAPLIKTRKLKQVQWHGTKIVKKMERGHNVFAEIDGEQASSSKSRSHKQAQSGRSKRGRPEREMVIAPTELRRKRSKKSTQSPTAETKTVGDSPDVMVALSAPFEGRGIDAQVAFLPLLLNNVDMKQVVGCERLEKCGCIVDVYLDSSSFLCFERIEFVIRRRLENAYKTRRRPTTSLVDSIYRLLCMKRDDFEDILAACARRRERKPVHGALLGEDELKWWVACSEQPSVVAPLRGFAFLRRLALPICARMHTASRGSTNGTSGADTSWDSSVCFPDFSLLDVLLQLEITQRAVIDFLFLRIVQLESVLEEQATEESKPLVRDFQRYLLSSIGKATAIKCFDRGHFIGSAQFMLIVLYMPRDLTEMVGEELRFKLSRSDIDGHKLVRLKQHSNWFLGMASSWKIPTDNLKDWRNKPMMWTVPPAAAFERFTPRPGTNEERNPVERIRQVLLGRNNAHELMREWNLEKLQKKMDILVGRNDGSALQLTVADMSLDAFLQHATIMDEANRSLVRQLDRPGARPRLQSVDMAGSTLSKIKSLFFDHDGSLREERKDDVEMTLKLGYINFENRDCSDERNDRRWQLPLKHHGQVRSVVPRAVLESMLYSEGVIDLRQERLDDVALLIGGTEDQSLHHDVPRAFTSFVSSTKASAQAESPIAGWEVGRLEYNAAMTSAYAPSSIILGMGDSPGIMLGVQKDQIRRVSPNQCKIIGGKDQMLEIVCERKHLVILKVDPGVMFTGDLPHCGVRNVPIDSPENELIELLNTKIAAILQDSSLTKRMQLSAIVDMLCNFPGLNKLCRLFSSTKLLHEKVKIPRNTVGFTDCLANPPGEQSAAMP